MVQTLLWVRRPIDVLEQCRKRYGPTFMLSLSPYELVLLTEPEQIRTVFAAKQDEMHAGGVNRILRSLVGDSSVLLLDGSEHMRHRKLLMRSFHGERMRLYGETMAGITRHITAGWGGDQSFALHPYMQDITLQVILRTVFGADEGAELSELSDQIKRLLSVAEYPMILLPVLYLSDHPELEKIPPFKWMLRDRDRTDALLYKQIAARRADDKAHERTDVLAMLIQAKDEAGESMTDVELRDELVTALTAGHETTATALAWAFEQILLHKEVYARLRAEVDAAGGIDASPDAIASLPYLDATIKEVLRLRPVIPIVGRILKRPYRLGGYDLKEGTMIGACIYLAQRDPETYPDPTAFKPERFLGTQPDPAAWLPFGGGIRRCVGAAFASYEMKIVLGSLLATFDLELAQKAPARVVRRAITFYPEGGTRVRAQRRQPARKVA